MLPTFTRTVTRDNNFANAPHRAQNTPQRKRQNTSYKYIARPASPRVGGKNKTPHPTPPSYHSRVNTSYSSTLKRFWPHNARGVGMSYEWRTEPLHASLLHRSHKYKSARPNVGPYAGFGVMASGSGARAAREGSGGYGCCCIWCELPPPERRGGGAALCAAANEPPLLVAHALPLPRPLLTRPDAALNKEGDSVNEGRCCGMSRPRASTGSSCCINVDGRIGGFFACFGFCFKFPVIIGCLSGKR